MNEVEDMSARYAAAVWERDAEAFLALYDPEVIIFDLWGPAPCCGIEAWARSVADWFGSLAEGERVRVAFDPVLCLINGNAATWAGSVCYLAMDDTDRVLQTMHNRLTWSLLRHGGVWRIIHEHTSAPVDHATMRTILDDPGAP